MNDIDWFPPQWTVVSWLQEVLATEQQVKAQIHSMWANDVEFWAIDAIVKQARNWVLDAGTAILQNQWVMDSKQAYH